jgi:nicotinamide-nucleotide amidase
MDSPDELSQVEDVAEQIARLAQGQRLTVATAESLTGGKIACRLAAAGTAADWFAGSVVAYMAHVKHEVLKVPEGPIISEQCAAGMAEGVSSLLGADLAVAVTGVGGPDEQEGQPPGSVWFGVFADGEARAEFRRFSGEPAQIVDATTAHALQLLLRHLTR